MAEFSVIIHGYWTNEEYFECIVNNINPNDNDDEKKEETYYDDNNHPLFSIIGNNKNQKQKHSKSDKTNDFLGAFVGDNDSSDEDIDLD